MGPLKRIASVLFWRYHRLRSSWPVWYYLSNRAPRREWRALGVALGEREREITRTLAKDGIALTHIDELAPGWLAELRAETEARLLRLAGQANDGRPGGTRSLLRPGLFSAETKKYQKDFLVDLWGEGETPLLDPANPFMRLVLDERVLGIIGAYLGMVPRFYHFSLLSTIIRPAGTPEQYSQRWHRDSEDRKMVKVFLYLTDVDALGAGPFSYVRGSHGGGRWRGLWPQRPPVGSYPPPGAVERAVPAGDIVTGLGLSGTLIFCDTTGLHRGGYSTTKERIMFTASYYTKASIHPRLFRIPGSIPGLSALARSALAD